MGAGARKGQKTERKNGKSGEIDNLFVRWHGWQSFGLLREEFRRKRSAAVPVNCSTKRRALTRELQNIDWNYQVSPVGILKNAFGWFHLGIQIRPPEFERAYSAGNYGVENALFLKR